MERHSTISNTLYVFLLLLIPCSLLFSNCKEDEKNAVEENSYEQMDLFTYYNLDDKKQQEELEELEREKRIQRAVLDIKKKYGKNAILKGMNLQEGATTKDRNNQIGGHRA